jgi:hypothetical protein
MARYPGATWKPFTQNATQSRIIPTQVILHSTAGGANIEATWQYTENGAGGTGTEYHFIVGYDGAVIQGMDTQVRADAQWDGNLHGVSIETASNSAASDPWSSAQAVALIDLGKWLLAEHPAIGRRECRTATDEGFGYHRLFTAWNQSNHSCPGNARIAQFPALLALILDPAHKPKPPAPPPLEDDEMKSVIMPFKYGAAPIAQVLVDMGARTWQWLPTSADVLAAEASGAVVKALSPAYMASLGAPQGPVPHL